MYVHELIGFSFAECTTCHSRYIFSLSYIQYYAVTYFAPPIILQILLIFKSTGICALLVLQFSLLVPCTDISTLANYFAIRFRFFFFTVKFSSLLLASPTLWWIQIFEQYTCKIPIHTSWHCFVPRVSLLSRDILLRARAFFFPSIIFEKLCLAVWIHYETEIDKQRRYVSHILIHGCQLTNCLQLAFICS